MAGREQAPTFEGFHIYGASAALKIEADRNAQHFPTVAVEAAHGSPGKAYAWDRKIRFQFTERELPTLLATLLGQRELGEFLYHGKNRDKALQIKLTPRGTVLRMIGRNEQGEECRFNVQLSMDGIFQFLALALRQLAEGYRLSPEVALALVQASAASMESTAKAQN